jgi:hypothetical protein
MEERSLVERIAQALSMPKEDVRSFSLLTLREVLRGKHPKLVAEIDELHRTGQLVKESRR